MISQLQKIVNNFNKPKNWLILANVFLVFFLIVLGNTKIVPLEAGDFVFFSALSLAFALWRPGWAFLFFCGTIPLENINLVPEIWGLMVRPYQFIGGILIIAIIIRKLTGRLNFKMPRFNLTDFAVLVLVSAGFLSAVVTSIEASMLASMPLKLSLIFATLAALYFLARIYIQDVDDLKRTIPFFLSSAAVVIAYGIWQNIAYLNDGNSFETMPGRPNGTFPEADWLAGFLVVIISSIYALLYYYRRFEQGGADSKSKPIDNSGSNECQFFCLSGPVLSRVSQIIFLILAFILLVISVSRSAWLAAFASLVIFIWIFFTDLKFRDWKWKETFVLKFKIFSSLGAAIFFVYVFHLTDFQLGNRVQSTGTGLQKITVSCANENKDLPENIQNASELEKYGCRHINLEDIATEKSSGNFVTEVYRNDPNVSIRAQIYEKSWQEVRSRPIFGIGWGSIGATLGRDGRGAVLNSSNIFLETWLGAGILGMLALAFLFGHVLFRAIRGYFYSTGLTQKTFNGFLISSWFGIIIFNLFNAGIFLGFLWVWLAIANIIIGRNHE